MMTRTHATWSSAAVLILLAIEAHAADPRRVLMLHAFNYTFPATTQVAEAARKRLLERSSQKIEIDADFLDLARITDPEHETADGRLPPRKVCAHAA